MKNMPGNIELIKTDVLVIGGGISGTYAAIKAREAGANVVQVDKGHVGKSGCSAFAAGVMFVFIPGEDNLDEWFAAEVRHRGFLVQQDRLQRHFEQVHRIIVEMEGFGVNFLKTPDGKLDRSWGRGKFPLIKFPGIQLMEVMAKTAKKMGVAQVNKTMITDLIPGGERINGAIGFDLFTGETRLFLSGATVLATGSTQYKGLSPGHRDCTGDGFAMAFRAGAKLSGADANDINYNAFPARYDIGPGMNMFVGQGGKLINARGERFMPVYHPGLAERAPLNTLAQAFAMEALQGKTPIYMDMTHFSKEQVRQMKIVLPLTMKMYERAGIVENEKFIKPIEWMLTAPYGRAGLRAGSNMDTTLEGLFVCGETAAMQSFASGLPACASSGREAGKAAAEYALKNRREPQASPEQLVKLRETMLQPLKRKNGPEPEHIILSLLETLTPYNTLVIRHETRMKKALATVEELKNNYARFMGAYDPHYLRTVHEVNNMLFTAEVQLKSAIFRQESRMAAREDFPFMDNDNWLRWINIYNDGGSIGIDTEEVPVKKYKLKPAKGKTLYRIWDTVRQSGLVSIKDNRVQWNIPG